MSKDTSKPTRGRPKTFNRERTLDVAIESYWREGVDGMSLNEICRRAGVSKPGLYREFGSEDQLMDAVLTRYRETVLTSVIGLILEDRPFKEVLASLVDAIVREEDVSVPAGCLFAKMRSSRWRLGPTTQAHVERLRAEVIAEYAGWIDRAKAHGEIRSGVSTEVAAAYLDTQLTNMTMQMSAGEDPGMVRAQAHLTFAALTGDSF